MEATCRKQKEKENHDGRQMTRRGTGGMHEHGPAVSERLHTRRLWGGSSQDTSQHDAKRRPTYLLQLTITLPSIERKKEERKKRDFK
jgi:hypothetical protein